MLNIIPALIRLHISCYISKDQTVSALRGTAAGIGTFDLAKANLDSIPNFHIYIVDILCIPLAPFITGLISFRDSNELMLAMQEV